MSNCAVNGVCWGATLPRGMSFLFSRPITVHSSSSMFTPRGVTDHSLNGEHKAFVHCVPKVVGSQRDIVEATLKEPQGVSNKKRWGEGEKSSFAFLAFGSCELRSSATMSLTNDKRGRVR